ncbi:MAG: hypothetical protein ACYS22_03710 [Planctomycetota bacterium]|jgi:hypothetical protein
MSQPAPPRVTNIVVDCVQQGEGVPEGGKSMSLSLRKRTLDQRMLLTCANPACKKGGYLLRRDVDKATADRKTTLTFTKPCAGYVGALRTEKGYADKCGNTLEVTVTITYATPKA